jgi:hypothetical protein
VETLITAPEAWFYVENVIGVLTIAVQGSRPALGDGYGQETYS